MKQIGPALCKAQAKIASMPLDGTNSHHRYKYTTSEAMISGCRAALSAQGLALIELEQTYELQTPNTGILWTTRMLLHESGESYAFPPRSWPIVVGGGRPIDKALACASTAGLSYFLRGLLLVPRNGPDEEMDDRDDRDVTPKGLDPQAVRRQFKSFDMNDEDTSLLEQYIRTNNRDELEGLWLKLKALQSDAADQQKEE